MDDIIFDDTPEQYNCTCCLLDDDWDEAQSDD